MTAPLSPVDAILAIYSKKGAERKPGLERGRFRASSVGYQPRRLAWPYFEGHAIDAEAPSARSMMTFEEGDMVHDNLRRRLVEAGVKGRIPVTKEAEEEWEKPIPCSAWSIRGHPDGVLFDVTHEGAPIGDCLLEIKTVNNFGWDKAVAGEIGDDYMDQATVNMWGLGLKHTYFLLQKKDTQHLADFVIGFDQARLDAIFGRLMATEEHLARCKTPLEVPACSGPEFGFQPKKLGRGKYDPVIEALAWRCSYCPYTKHCFPDAAAFVVGGKPVWARKHHIPADACVVAMGVNVIPEPGWKLAGGADDAD